LIGVSRGVLRVASGALVLDATGVSDSEKGASSAIYLAGLDLGKILGPLIGGATAAAVGLRGTFVVLGVVFPIAYFAVTAGMAAPQGAVGTRLTGYRSKRRTR
jgi:MFS family permease